MPAEEKVARLSLIVDSSQAENAVSSLDRLTAVGKNLEEQTKRITAETRKAAAPIKSVSSAAKYASGDFDSIAKTSNRASQNISNIGKNAPSVSQSMGMIGKSVGGTKNSIDQYNKSAGNAIRITEKLNEEFSNSNRIFSGFGGSFGGVIGSIAAFLSIQEIGQAADEWTNLTNRLKLVTDSSESLAKAQSDVFRIAQEASAPLSETAELYQRIATSAEELKLSSEEVVGIVTTISKTLAISGANAASSQAALTQLGQAFASGVLRGEEFNSVMEQTPALARAIADGVGVGIGKLRALAMDGKLTTDVVIAALKKQEEAISDSFEKMAPTMSSALTVANNSFMQLIGTMDKTMGISSGVANALISVSGAMDTLSKNSDLIEKTLGVALAIVGGKAASTLLNFVKSMQASAVASRTAAAASAQKALADEKAALSSLAVVKAEQQRAIAAVAAANSEVAASKSIQIAEINRLRSSQQAIAAELALEQTRHKAQITDVGRQQSIARMAELRLSEVAIIKQLQMAETSLAASSAANSARMIAALEARRAATINLAAAESSVAAATAARSTAMIAMTSASSLGALALTRVAAAGRGLLGILGGPVGLIVTLGLTAASFVDFGESAENAFDAATAAATKADEKVKSISRSIIANDLKLNIDTASFDQIGNAIDEITKKLEEAEKEQERMQAIFNSDVPQIGGNKVTIESLEEIDIKVKALTSSLGKLQKAQSETRFSGVGEAQKFLDTLVKQNKQIQDLTEKEKALDYLRQIKIDKESEIGKKILQQAEANDALKKSEEAKEEAIKKTQKEITDSANKREKALQDEKRKQEELINQYKSVLNNYKERINLTNKSTQVEKLNYDLTNTNLANLDAAQKKQLLNYAEAVDKIEELNEKKKEQNKIDEEAQEIADRLKPAKGIQRKYEEERKIILDSQKITKEEETELLVELEKEKNEALLDESDDYWAKWLKSAEDNLMNFEKLSEEVINNFTSGFGDAFEEMIFDSKSLEDAMASLAENMLRSITNAIGQMIAQWVAYQAIQLVSGKSTQAAAATQMTSNAYAMALMGGINAFASTAAIPIVGPFMAPGAMAAAEAILQPMATAVSSLAVVGMAHEGIMSIPQDGTWLLKKGERVTTEQTSKKLDKMLDGAQKGMGGQSINQVFNITTQNADSFRSSERQILKNARRSLQ